MSPGLKYGLLGGAGMICWMLGEYALGLHTTRVAFSRYTNWVTELILLVALWRLLHHQLHRDNRYWLPVWQGMLQGLLASLVAGMLVYIYLSLYLRFINPEYPYHFLDWSVARMREHGMDEAGIRLKARAFLWGFTPVGLLVSSIGFNLLIGFFASPVITLWLNWRRKEVVQAG